jgi:tyrosinase
MMEVRRNQRKLTQPQWGAFIDAVNATHGMGIPAPRYRDFVRVHVEAMTTAEGMTWAVHTMPGMGTVGRNFLAWHRWYLVQLERRLRVVDAKVTIPYWDWTVDREIPQALTAPSLLQEWGVTRAPSFHGSNLPTRPVVKAVSGISTFTAFQTHLEGVHGAVHNAVGGTMATAASPTDPLFWLHHANVDRIWAGWEAAHPGELPPNVTERLKPSRVAGAPLFGVTVSSVTSIHDLGYSYR